jgi:hypothetical protein
MWKHGHKVWQQIWPKPNSVRRTRMERFHVDPVDVDAGVFCKPKLVAMNGCDGSQFDQLIAIDKVAHGDQCRVGTG